ncbi:hypothetical protein [Anaerolentibacter hominis]|uniref:hypothetical protein n=1 Tax=Anaerolentibacter hominis TaxID=3079009 RepID=UPI0031B87074
MKNTKIVVLRVKEIIYTALFVALGILLILLLIFMFLPSDKSEPTMGTPAVGDEISEIQYTPGVYTTEFKLNNTVMNLEVVVDEDHINSVSLVNIDSDVTTMYPLIEPALESISLQLSNGVSLEKVVLSEDSRYTQTLLMETIAETLNKAKVEKDDLTVSK